MRRLVGLVLLLAAPALAWARWNDATRAIAEADATPPRRTHADSVTFETIEYHAVLGRQAHAERWRVTGYATLGVLGPLLGVALMWPRRKAAS